MPTGTPIASSTTGAQGAYNLALSPAPTGPVGFVVNGGTFVSEEDGARITNPSTLTTVESSVIDGQTVELNPLTDFVFVRMFEDMAHHGTPFATALNNANTEITGLYGLGTNPDLLIPDYTSAGIGSHAGKLGLVLGALINEDQLLCPSAPGELVIALADDLSDGTFDGKQFGNQLSYCGGNLPAIAGTAYFEDALSGIFGSQLLPRAFTFGGTNNSLTLNNILPSQLVSSVSDITAGIHQALPASVNTITAGPAMGILSLQDREGATATLLENGKVLIAGGESTSGGPRNDAVLYDSAGNSFSTVSSTMSAPRFFATATLLPSGKVLIAGGRSTSGAILKSTDLFDPSNSTFTQGPDMSDQREHAAAVLLIDGTVLIAGGDPGSGALATTDIYTPAATGTGAFANGQPMGTPRTQLMATILTNGNALFAGGANNTGTLSSAEIYDQGSNTFSATSNTMLAARQQGTATLLPTGNVLIAGGLVTGDFSGALRSTELYLVATNAFKTPRSVAMNVARANMTANLTASNVVFIAGGDSVSGGAGLSSTELYSVDSDSFSAAPVTLSVARALPTGTLLPTGDVLIAGGFVSSGSGTTNTTDLYTP